ncbi:cupin domain-containing protein [Muricoccus radiodurans]|uniref:cupin domain-containing protein n=1 Tax=Muricoccus radiodurans TaxID=2231721 RepID=UPI003CEA089B
MSDVMEKDVTVVEPGMGEVLNVFGAAMIVKADPATDGLFLGEHVIPPGYFVPPHIHAEDDEVFFVLEGELTVSGAAGERRIGPGATARLPAGSRHGFRNDTSSAVRFLVMARPGLQGLEMFRHFDRAGRAAPGGLTPREIVAICGEYGVTMG